MSAISSKKLFKRVLSAAVMAPLALLFFYVGGFLFMALVAGVYLLALSEWVQMAAKLHKHRWIALVGGAVYMALSFLCFYILRAEYSFEFIILFVLMIWSSDTGAYFTGKLIGGPRMAEQISPKKTWAGFVGAVLAPALIFALYLLQAHPEHISWIGIISVLAAGGVIGALGQVGDLSVSFFKRIAGVKDAGQIIPGHGGILDRIDSMMISCPVFLLMLTEYFYVLG